MALTKVKGSVAEKLKGSVAEKLNGYADLRLYRGDSDTIELKYRSQLGDGAGGVFVRKGSAVDNDGTVIVDALGRSWERQFSGPANAKWWGVGSYPANGTSALQNAINSGNAHIVIDSEHHVAITSVTMSAEQALEINGKITKLSGTSPIITLNNSCKVFGAGSIDGNSIAATGVDGNAKTDLLVSSLRIFNIGGKGVNLTHCANYKVANLWLNSITQQGINLDVSSNGEVYGNAVVNALHGIQFWGGDASASSTIGISDIAIYGNRVADVTGGIWGSLGKNIAVSGNTVKDCEDVGIDFEGCQNSSMTGNTVSNCHNGGLSLFFGSKHCVISGNTVENNATSGLKNGIWFTDADNSHNTVAGNTVKTTNNGNSFYFGDGSKYNTVNGNAFTGGTANAWRLSYSSITSNTIIDGKLCIIGGIYNHVEGNTLIRNSSADATSPNEAPIYITWSSSSWPSQVNTVCNNLVIGWRYSITDDCWGDILSLNDCSNNRVSGPLHHRGTGGWFGRMTNNALISNPNVSATVLSY